MKFFHHALLSLLAVGLQSDSAFGSGIRAREEEEGGEHRNLHGGKDFPDYYYDDESSGAEVFDENSNEGFNEEDFAETEGLNFHRHPKHYYHHYHDHPEVPPYESYDRKAGCDCTTEDSDDILDAQSKALLSVSFTYALGDKQTRNMQLAFAVVEDRISKCVNLGLEILAALHCGGCVDAESSFTKPYAYFGTQNQEASSEGSPDFKGGSIKTYDCCCDSDSIKDIIKDELFSIVAAAPLLITGTGKTGNDEIFDAMTKGFKAASILAIKGIVKGVYFHKETVKKIMKRAMKIFDPPLLPAEAQPKVVEGGEEVGTTPPS